MQAPVAADPVKGAIIVVARGGKTLNLRTDATGHASTSYTGGVKTSISGPNTKLTATAIAPGYDNAIITVGRGG